MTPDAYRAELLELAYAAAPDAHELPAFGPYRELIRGRLFALAQKAYRRSWARLGARACDACFARYLAASPPTSPLVREVIAGFGLFAVADPLADGAPFARDLLRFEAAKWTVSDVPAPELPELAELDFVGEPVLNPTLRVLELAHVVDVADGETPTVVPHALLIYRRQVGARGPASEPTTADDDVRWYRVAPLFGALITWVQVVPHSIGSLLPKLLREHGVTADEVFLGELAAALTVAVERGVVLGVRARPRGAQSANI
jgi:hypothetical protein